MELQQRCKDRIEEVYKVAEAKYERTFTRVPVTFSNRMTRCAGVAKSMRFGETVVPKEIRLSNVFLKSDTENFIKDTPGHEAAHLIAGEMFGSVGHDHTWQAVMAVIGQPANRLHNFERPASKSFKYRCSEGLMHDMTLIRHNKLQRGKVVNYRYKNGGTVGASDWVK